ncbi:LacI family DNA-binding transcriptional regulator [Clostridium sp. E02]|uniref:LacI family DNA-binding transcriptional regulator n=1 Tax=Clostridium sp. E02 TaxID=2487134 RepID=UPI000F52009D|nr:LacI family DNA-binding transcriptional regulator [Clostridium sp. E02]
MSKTVTLSDIAKKVGVSTVTVSKALSDKTGVSEDMRKKIKGVAFEIGYQMASPVKKKLAGGTGNLGILIPAGFLDTVNSFYWNIYQFVVTSASKRGYYCILEIVSQEEEMGLSMPKMILDGKVDGAILIGQTDKAYSDFLWNNQVVPVIYMDFYEANEEYDTVISDGFYGMYLLTDYLIKNGHERIAFVGTPLSTSSITDRYFGYMKALLEHHIAFRQDWVIHDRNLSEGHKAFLRISLPEEMPTAFACSSDYTADVLMNGLEEAGYRIPEDISVVGFDNCEWDKVVKVPITTYDVKKDRLAELAVKNLVRKIRKEPFDRGIQIVAGRLVKKKSVAGR